MLTDSQPHRRVNPWSLLPLAMVLGILALFAYFRPGTPNYVATVNVTNLDLPELTATYTVPVSGTVRVVNSSDWFITARRISNGVPATLCLEPNSSGDLQGYARDVKIAGWGAEEREFVELNNCQDLGKPDFTIPDHEEDEDYSYTLNDNEWGKPLVIQNNSDHFMVISRGETFETPRHQLCLLPTEKGVLAGEGRAVYMDTYYLDGPCP